MGLFTMRTWDTNVRKPWNRRIYYLLKAIDHHNELYFKTLNIWHLEQADYLRKYVYSLKDWILEEEQSTDIVQILSFSEDT
mgnify:CR=1 FL=1